MDEILGKGHFVWIPRGTTIKRGKNVTTAGKRYRVCLDHSYGPVSSSYQGWEGAPINPDWNDDYVVVWTGSGNLWMQARMVDVEPEFWIQEEIERINLKAEELYGLLNETNDIFTLQQAGESDRIPVDSPPVESMHTSEGDSFYGEDEVSMEAQEEKES